MRLPFFRAELHVARAEATIQRGLAQLEAASQAAVNEATRRELAMDALAVRIAGHQQSNKDLAALQTTVQSRATALRKLLG